MNGKQSYVIGACDAARIAEMKGRQGRKWEASTARADGPTVGGTRATAAGGTALTEPGEGGGGKADASSTRIQRTQHPRSSEFIQHDEQRTSVYKRVCVSADEVPPASSGRLGASTEPEFRMFGLAHCFASKGSLPTQCV